MPYLETRRLYGMVGKKVSKHMGYRKAKKAFNDINRDTVFFESRFLRSRMGRA